MQVIGTSFNDHRYVMIGLGFIGVGGMGLFQVRAFSQVRGAKLVAAADPAAGARKHLARLEPQAVVYADHRDLLADNRVEAVVVAVPTHHHARMAIDVLKSGRPVLVEKPMARTVAAAHRMIDAADKARQLLMVAHCRRYDADWGTFAKIYRAGMIGQPILWRHVMGGRGPLATWFMDHKLGGGPMIDGAVHDQDFANRLFGNPEVVCASSIKLTDHSAVDTATAVVHYGSGDQLMLCWSWGTAPSGAALQDALGTRGSVLFNPPDLKGPDIDTTKFGYYRVTNKRTDKSRLMRFVRNDMYVVQARHFVDCVNGKAKCRSPGTEAIKAVAVAEAILKAGPKGMCRKVTW